MVEQFVCDYLSLIRSFDFEFLHVKTLIIQIFFFVLKYYFVLRDEIFIGISVLPFKYKCDEP